MVLRDNELIGRCKCKPLILNKLNEYIGELLARRAALVGHLEHPAQISTNLACTIIIVVYPT